MKNITIGVFILLFYYSCSDSNIRFGAISSASPEATEVGMKILKKGGNAADAAIAVQFALGITEPAMSGIGGGTQVQIKLPEKAIPFAINGSTLSPLNSPSEYDKDSLIGMQRSTVPSTIKVLEYLYNKYGSGNISWAELIQPSIQLAENDYSFSGFRKKVYLKYQQKLIDGLPGTGSYLTLNKHNNKLNFKNIPLANALKLIAKEGADAFYKGEIATSIIQDSENLNGWISQNDLLNFPEPEELTSIRIQYNGYDIFTQPEPCGGPVLREILNYLNNQGACQIKLEDFEMVEALNYGHESRKIKASENKNASGETTHFSIMDKDGMALSVTSSINAYYGAGVANEKFGFLYNSYMDDFNFDSKFDKYAVGPNKMAYSSMSPTIVMKDGDIMMVIGSPGSGRIISTVAQLIHLYTCDELAKKELNAVKRLHATNKNIYLESSTNILNWNEEKLDSSWSLRKAPEELVQNGLNPYFGGVHMIINNNGEILPTADPRRDGSAMTK